MCRSGFKQRLKNWELRSEKPVQISSFSILNSQFHKVSAHAGVGGPEFVVEVKFAGEGFVAQFDAVGEVAQLELMTGGSRFLLDPVAIDARFSGFPEVAVAQVAVALHGHDDAIGG